MSPCAASRFKIKPDPPIAGQPLEVVYVGPASEVEWQVDGGATKRATPDQDGKFRIPALPTGVELTFSDNLGIPGYLQARILDALR